MREIKFRAWDKFENKMYKVEIIRWNCFNEITQIAVYENDSICKSYVKNHNVERHDILALELMQFTGLKDKNGKEIYENQALFDEKEQTVCTVFFNEDYGQWYVEYKYDYTENATKIKPLCDVWHRCVIEE